MGKKVENHIIREEADSFIIDRRARQLSARTVEFYQYHLDILVAFCEKQTVASMEDLTALVLRELLAEYGEDHNKGGVHCLYRCLKAFCNWFEVEMDGEWKNPIKKVQAPSAKHDPIPGITDEQIACMVGACQGHGWLSRRDEALLLFLYDTGLRRNECLALTITDVDLESKTVQVYNGKGSKDRVGRFGNETALALRRYLRGMRDRPGADPFWLNERRGPLQPPGLRQILRRRAEQCGYPEISAHDFRRGFALKMLRNGADLLSVSRLLGHSSLEVTKRYLALTEEDLARVHAEFSPGDSIRPRRKTKP